MEKKETKKKKVVLLGIEPEARGPHSDQSPTPLAGRFAYFRLQPGLSIPG